MKLATKDGLVNTELYRDFGENQIYYEILIESIQDF